MQKRLSKNLKHYCLEDTKAELEIVCVVIGKKKTQIVVDYGGGASNISFNKLLETRLTELKQCIRTSFELRFNYDIFVEISKKRWKVEKTHFVEKFITQQKQIFEQEILPSAKSKEQFQSTQPLNLDSFGSLEDTIKSLSNEIEESVSYNKEKYIITVSKKNAKKNHKQDELNNNTVAFKHSVLLSLQTFYVYYKKFENA